MRLLAGLSAIASLVQASVHPGSCASEFSYGTRADKFDKLGLTGLWFEYVWDEQYADDLQYKCAMWTVLRNDEEMLALNHMNFGEGTESKFG